MYDLRPRRLERVRPAGLVFQQQLLSSSPLLHCRRSSSLDLLGAPDTTMALATIYTELLLAALAVAKHQRVTRAVVVGCTPTWPSPNRKAPLAPAGTQHSCTREHTTLLPLTVDQPCMILQGSICHILYHRVVAGCFPHPPHSLFSSNYERK